MANMLFCPLASYKSETSVQKMDSKPTNVCVVFSLLLHIEPKFNSFFSIILDGKYVVLPSGELQIRNVSPEDGFKTYKCRTKHRLTGETKLSATAGRLVITGKSA